MIDASVYILKPEVVRIAESARIDWQVKIEGGNGVTIGEHCHISSFSHLNVGGGRLDFGDHSGCSSHVVICSGQPDLAFRHISAADLPENQHPLRLRTTIGRHVVIFAGAVILPGVTVGDYAVIGAGAVVTKDVPAFAVMMGVPARMVDHRWRGLGQALDWWSSDFPPAQQDKERWTMAKAKKAAAESPIVAIAKLGDVERVKAEILKKYGFEVTDEYCRDLVAFVEQMLEMTR